MVMTDKEKAKAYDGNYKVYTELINRLENVKDAIKNQNYGIAMDILCKPYPEFQITTSTELAESKDERIRKELTEFLKNASGGFLDTTIQCKTFGKWLAWLEKQEGCEHIKKEWLEHIKQSWYKEGFIDGKYSDVKGCTINDDVILKELIDFLENRTAKLQHDLTRYANWLKIQFTPFEKQGEQKVSYTTLVKTGDGGINALVTRELLTNSCD